MQILVPHTHEAADANDRKLAAGEHTLYGARRYGETLRNVRDR
jgi:hypothetical protein